MSNSLQFLSIKYPLIFSKGVKRKIIDMLMTSKEDNKKIFDRIVLAYFNVDDLIGGSAYTDLKWHKALKKSYNEKRNLHYFRVYLSFFFRWRKSEGYKGIHNLILKKYEVLLGTYKELEKTNFIGF